MPVVGTEKVKEKFFIVKSLTIEDLELSARNGTWATQAHNEAALNLAYQVCTGPEYCENCADDITSLQKVSISCFRPTSQANTLAMLA